MTRALVHNCGRIVENTPKPHLVSGRNAVQTRTIKGENRSAPGVGELNRGLASRDCGTKGVPVESTQKQQDRIPYPAVVASLGVCR